MRKKLLCAVLACCIAVLSTGCREAVENGIGDSDKLGSYSSDISISESAADPTTDSSSDSEPGIAPVGLSGDTETSSSSSQSPSSSMVPDSSSSDTSSTSSSDISSSSIPSSSSAAAESSSTAPSSSSSTVSEPEQNKPEIIGKYDQRAMTAEEKKFCDEVFRLTNEVRAEYGLPAFKQLDSLTGLAVARAWENTVSYGHNRPDGSSCFTIFGENGMRYHKVAENVAAGQKTPSAVVNAWMNSEGHRKNILNSDYEYLGVGFYRENKGYGYFWTQLFYTP